MNNVFLTIRHPDRVRPAEGLRAEAPPGLPPDQARPERHLLPAQEQVARGEEAAGLVREDLLRRPGGARVRQPVLPGGGPGRGAGRRVSRGVSGKVPPPRRRRRSQKVFGWRGR